MGKPDSQAPLDELSVDAAGDWDLEDREADRGSELTGYERGGMGRYGSPGRPRGRPPLRTRQTMRMRGAGWDGSLGPVDIPAAGPTDRHHAC